MVVISSLLPLALGLLLKVADGAFMAPGTGSTLTNWDCCKPACAWGSIASKSGGTGSAKVCNKDNSALATRAGQNEQSSCDKTRAGGAYLCSDYAPRPMAEDWSYAFAVSNGAENCCKCFNLTWTDGPAAGKRVVLQVINEGGSVNTDGSGRQFILLTPGGGVGPNTQGCTNQFGSAWGNQYGGVQTRDDCNQLPDPLQGGCFWRFNWAKGVINNWNVTYSQITCPDYLAQTSGCKA